MIMLLVCSVKCADDDGQGYIELSSVNSEQRLMDVVVATAA